VRVQLPRAVGGDGGVVRSHDGEANAGPGQPDAQPKIASAGTIERFLSERLGLRAAAAADEEERDGHDCCENDKNDVEHEVPFVLKADCPYGFKGCFWELS
jgi:hypothetical protein